MIERTLICFLLLCCGAADAAGPKAAIFAARVKTKLGTTAFARQVDAMLAEVAKRGGYVISTPKIDEVEETCREIDCLPRIAERHDLDVILAAVIDRDATIGEDTVQIILFRKTSPKSLRTEQEPCSACDAKRALERVERLGTQLLRSDPGTGSPPLEPLQLINPDALNAASAAAARRRTIYRALGWTSAALFAGSVALTAAMGARHGACDDPAATGPGDCRKRVDATAGIAVGTGLMALTAAGTIGFFVAGYQRSHPATKVTLSPLFSPDGFAVAFTVLR